MLFQRQILLTYLIAQKKQERKQLMNLWPL